MLEKLDERASVPYEKIIKTRANLKFWVFRDICIIIGIDHRKYELNEKIIDTELVEHRNNIAHGKYLLTDYQGYINTYNIVTQLMRDIKDDILNAAINEKFRRI